MAPVSALPVLRELHEDEEIARRHVATLRDVGASLREAAQAMEDERAELRQFLDGSRDALERLEEWAGSRWAWTSGQPETRCAATCRSR